MGTTIKTILRKNRGYYGEINFPKQYNEKKLRSSRYLTLINKTNISRFKEEYSDIWENSKKLIVFREPVDRLLSCYNYIRRKKKKFRENYTEVIEEMQNRKGTSSELYDLNKKNYDSIHIHLYASQLDLIDCNLSDIEREDYKWLKMDNSNYVLNEMKNLGIDYVYDLVKNENKNKKFYPTLQEIEKYKEVFKEDFLAYNLIKNENSSHN